jgi:hypothetical protein
MSVHTLIEYAKGYDGSAAEKAIIELFPEELDFLGIMPFKAAPGGRYGYYREGALPTNMGFRAINEEPTAGFGVINELTEQCFPIAGNLDVDKVLIDRHGAGRRATQERMQIKAAAKTWGDTFIDGNNQSNPKEWSGLKTRLKVVGGDVAASNYDSRVVANDQSSGGGALSLKMLDLALGHTEMPNALLMPKKLLTRFGAAQRDTNIGGFITFDKDEMGKRVARYGDTVIYTGYGITPFGEFLPFTETGYGGGSAVTASIYAIHFGEEGVCGLETTGMQVKDLGLLNNGVHMRTNVQHDNGLCIEGPYSATRLTSITDAAIIK